MSLQDLIRGMHGPSTLVPALDEYHLRMDALPSNRASGWHPSEFCGMCPRERVLRKVLDQPGDPFVIDARLRRIFDTGTALHEWYQNKYLGPMGILWGKWECGRCRTIRWGYMPKDSCECQLTKIFRAPRCEKLCDAQPKKMKERGGCLHCGIWGQWEYQEVPVEYSRPVGKETVRIVGHSDGIVNLNGEPVALEMKSINDRGFGMLPGPKEGHLKQLQIYMALMKRGKMGARILKELGEVKRGIVLYINKNTSAQKEFLVERDVDMQQSLLDGPVEYTNALLEKRLPEKDEDCPTMFAKKAKGCDMVSYCFGGKDFGQLIQLRKST